MKKIGLILLCTWQFIAFGQSNVQANWQQDVSYNIQVTLDDENHILNGQIDIGYTNNSPQTLNEVWIHLWPNAYKNNLTAFAKQQLENNSTSFYFAKPKARGYIDSLDFTVDAQSLKLTYHPEHVDLAKLTLNTPLKPGESIVISSPFRVKVPGSFSRMGHVRNSYQITQWFPKPAVYDVNGWNTMPYLDQGEFYSEFGSFNVSITVPQNYVVAATGVLQDSSEMDWLNDRITYYKGRGKREEDETASSALLKTLHFKQDKIHDFAWFADKEFFVFESKQTLSDSSATINTYLYSTNEYDKSAIQYVNQGVKFYSDKVGNYPYASASAVIGPLKAGGGMEYPMITVLASTDKTTIVHEVGHNWFYGIIGTNERNFPWMDESINTYYENRHSKSTKDVSDVFKPNYNSKYAAQDRFADGLSIVYANSLTRNTDQAIDLHSKDYTSSNYGGIIYGKGAYIFSLLQQFLGDSLFDSAMQNFYEEWKFKHPLPGDFEASIKKSTNQDLDWFFDELLSTTKNYDYKVKKIRYKKIAHEELSNHPNNYQVLVKNTGKVAAPFQLMTLDENGEKLKSRWDSGFVGKRWVSLPGTERYLSLTNENLKNKEGKRMVKRMDKVNQVAVNLDNPLNEVNIHNNRIRAKGLLKKTEKFALGGANHLDRRTTPSLVPLANYNYYDNWMIGGSLNNLAHWERRFHYYAAGFYSGSLQPLKYELYARQMFALNMKSAHRLDLYAKAASFGYEHGIGGLRSTYQKLNGGLSVYLKNQKKPNSRAFRKIDLTYNKLFDVLDKNHADAASITPTSYASVVRALYSYKSNKKLNPLEYQITFEQLSAPSTITFLSSNNQKLFGEITKVFHFSKMKNYLKTRFFTGFIFGNNKPSTYLYSAGGNNGLTDYTYDRNLLARSERFNSIPNGVLGARVLVSHFSGMRIPVWMPSQGSVQSVNLEYNFTKKMPFNIYLDMSYSNGNNAIFNNDFNYVGGINFVLIKNYVEFSLPLVYSKDFANQMDFTGVKESKHLSTNYNPFKNWHRLIVFKLKLDFSKDDLINLSGL